MPNPLSKVNPTAKHWNFGPKAVQDEPDLAKWITNIIVTWPHLEEKLGWSLAALLRTEAHIGVAIYSSLTSTAAQREILEHAAEVALASDEDLPLFLAMLDALKSVIKQRNPLAHDMWGSSTDVPGALLCLQAKAQLERRGAAVRQWLISNTLTVPPKLPKLDYSKVMVYREQDFKNIFQAMHDLIQHFSDFWRMRDGQPPGRAVLRSKLENAPDLQERIRRRRAGDQSIQKSPPPPPEPEAPLK